MYNIAVSCIALLGCHKASVGRCQVNSDTLANDGIVFDVVACCEENEMSEN